MRRIHPLSPAVCAFLFAILAGAEEKPVAPPFIGQLSLVRYDMPRGFSDGYAPTRQLAKRRDAPDAVDWPNFSLNGNALFRDAAETSIELELRKGGEAFSPFQLGTDEVIQPGNHWFRALNWRGGLRHIYTADKTARAANASETMTGRYELWTFPILIKGEGGPVVKNVELRAGGALAYHKAGPWRSLTLLVPANQPGQPYELRVDGRPPVTFDAGLMAVKLGDPHERLFTVNTALPGDGPRIAVLTPSRPEEFPNPIEWQADMAALAQPQPMPLAPPARTFQSLQRHIGVDVPHSPLTIYAAALPLAMSGGFFKKGMSAEEYARFVSDTGYDAIFEQANALPAPGDSDSLEQRAAALGRHSVRFGLQYDNNWSRPALQHPNVAFFAHTLPEWHAPLYRSVSLAAQRFARLPNFAGLSIGASNGGYVSFSPWAPPIPDRPWGEAMIEFMGTSHPNVPRAPSLGSRELPFEVPVKTTAEFLRYVERYETTFRQYGYFADAVREVDPRIVFTTGSFGSSQGAGGRGGWPWASIPGRVMHEGLSTQQAYDWNETHAAKPLHNVALIDRLHSYHAKKQTWTIVDNFHYLYGREAFQRACVLALTRGIQGLGTNFLANPSGDAARPDMIAWQKEFYTLVRKFAGVFARAEPDAVVGIFYSYHQALQRRILTAQDAPSDKLLEGSHEGKVTEALFLCHAAGWPARVITYQEIMRGPLPISMKAILLVGLDQPDETWDWARGLEAPLQQFIQRGGRILADEESQCPAPFIKTGLLVAAYVPQSNFDATPLLFARNRENIAKLRAAMQDAARPIAASESETMWAIPMECADTQYVTVVNQAFEQGAAAQEMLRPADPKATRPEIWKTKGNASLYVKPQIGLLTWNTDRPIYDLRLTRKLTTNEASRVDLTTDAFRWYALPPAEVVPPEIKVDKGVSGYFEATVAMRNGVPMDGIPVELTVSHGDDSASVYTSTGLPTRLPLNEEEAPGDYQITATELLTGLSRSTKLALAKSIVSQVQSSVLIRQASALARFTARKHVVLTVALTPAQEKDATLVAQANALVAFYQQAGRAVMLGKVRPGDLIESLQPLKSPHRYPQWKTIASDLVLFGTPSNNVLLLDQFRGQIFPLDFMLPTSGAADVIYTRSPFVGEYDVVNIVASDTSGVVAAVKTITTLAKND